MTSFANQADMQHTAIDVSEFGDRFLTVGRKQLALFASVPLDAPRPGMSEALIVVHGALRNARDYYQAVMDADGGSGRRIIVAPQFLTDVDIRERPQRSGLLHWATEDWKGGFGQVSSFEVMDQVLLTLSRFPDLECVTIVGNSAGGQFVNRYAAVGRGAEKIQAQVRYVVANPSTYLYFDRQRPTDDGFVDHTDVRIDEWRYGFSGMLPRYVRGPQRERYFRQYIERDVTYLLGEDDDDRDAALLEIHPAAEAQGSTRLERGENYYRYLQHKAGRQVHDLVRVPDVGHDAYAMFGSPAGVRCLFSGPTDAGPRARALAH